MTDIIDQSARLKRTEGCHHFAPMRTVSVNGSAPNLMQAIPQNLADYPSMMSLDEKSLLFHLAKEKYTGEGLIIDAGIFLGASTHCFAEGLRRNTTCVINESLAKPLVSFEMGLINPGMPGFFQRNNVDIAGKPGEAFLPFLQKSLDPLRSVLDLRLGDITETMVDIDRPVEILFLDVLKHQSISEKVVSHFFPLLIPGKSIVIQQDYFNELLEYIKVHQELFGHCFEYVGEVQSSAIFLCKRKMTRAMVRSAIAGVEAAEQERLATIAMQRSVDPARRYLMAVSKARLISRLRGGDAALAYLDKIEMDYPEGVLGGKKFDRRLSGVMATAIAQCTKAGAKPPAAAPAPIYV